MVRLIQVFFVIDKLQAIVENQLYEDKKRSKKSNEIWMKSSFLISPKIFHQIFFGNQKVL